VAVYSPSSLRKQGAVTHRARVIAIDVKPRANIDTPWFASRRIDELQVVYQLDYVEVLRNPIVNRSDDGKGQRFSSPRWASRLSLERAQTISELFLETEPEWRLYEELTAAHIPFKLIPASPGSLRDDLNWRTWFETENGIRVRYAGPSGFRLEPTVGDALLLASPVQITHYMHSIPKQY
jgi:hypothetical protein